LQREEAYKVAQQCAQFLKERFNVDNVYIFGSVVGDGIWHKRSDIDIAVEGLPSENYMRAYFDMYDLLPPGLDLDLITLENAPVKMRERVKSINDQNGNVKMRENKIARLKRQIEAEFDNLDKVLSQINECLEYVSESIPKSMIMRSIGSCVHDFYNGTEKIFERIAVLFDGDTPDGENWHTSLLEQMKISSPNRSAVISHELEKQLLEYLKFRHLFRNIYGGDLDWNKLYPLAIGVSDVLKTLKEQITCFLNKFQELDEGIEKCNI
jgi:predicted nucleotidyltransferase